MAVVVVVVLVGGVEVINTIVRISICLFHPIQHSGRYPVETIGLGTCLTFLVIIAITSPPPHSTIITPPPTTTTTVFNYPSDTQYI